MLVTVTLISIGRSVVLQILGDEPVAVTRDGIALNKFTTSAQFEAADTGWRADTQARFVFIKFQHFGGTTKIDF